MRRLTATISLVGAFVLGLGGIGSASVLATKKPCELLKTAEITKVMGQPVGPPTEGLANPVLTQCYWDVPATGALPAASVGTIVAQGSMAKAAYDVNRQLQTAERVRGIKKAFYDSALQTLSVLRGDVLLSVQVLSFGGDPTVVDRSHYKQIVKLTKIALKRLK